MPALLLMGFLSLGMILQAEEEVTSGFRPSRISAGPVLFFKQPKRQSKELALYFFDPSIHGKPQIIWQDRYHPNPQILKRPSEQQLLMEFQDRLHLLEIPTSKVTPLLRGKEQNRLIVMEGKTIYFFQRTVQKRVEDLGMKLGQGPDGRTVVEKYFRPRDILFQYEVGPGGGARKVVPLVIEHLLEVTDEGFLVITADKPRKIARISRAGKVTEVCSFASNWIASMTMHAISPKGDYVAFSTLGRHQDFHKERTLMIWDLKNNKVCYSDPDVPLGPNLFSGRSNFLELTWLADDFLQYGGPFSSLDLGGEESALRIVNVVKQVHLNEQEISKLPKLPMKVEPERKPLGEFEVKFGEVYFPGERTPVASVLDDQGVGVRDLALDSRGEWFAYSERKDDHIYLIDGVNRKVRKIHTGWAHDLKWLNVDAQE